MGLSFLNKKIWHPGSFSNIEKVWIAEQKHKEIEKKIIENAKKVKEERAIEELKKLQVESGLIPKSHLNRLDFMYEGPDCYKNIISPEEFLLGKSIEDEGTKKKHFTPVFQESYSNPQNEAFTKVHEDPLFLIKKEELRQRKEIEENPYKVNLLLKDIHLSNNSNKKRKLSRSRSRNDKKHNEDIKIEKKNKHSDSHHHHHHHHHQKDKRSTSINKI